MHTSLDHEKLEVYQASLEFITWTIPVLEGLPGSGSVRNQLDRASTSVPLNIAEGNGKFTSPDRCRFFDNARGSALESAACLDVMVAKRFVSAAEIQAGKAMLVRIVSMLFGLSGQILTCGSTKSQHAIGRRKGRRRKVRAEIGRGIRSGVRIGIGDENWHIRRLSGRS